MPRITIFIFGAFLIAAVIWSSPAQAQDAISGHFTARYDLHAGVGLPSGLSVGARIWTGRDAGIEVSAGTLIYSWTLSAGIYFPAPSLFADTRPSWTLLGTYYRGGDAIWYGISGMYGLLQLGISGMHAYIRAGASLMIKSAAGPNSGFLFYPLPAFDVGLSWGFQ